MGQRLKDDEKALLATFSKAHEQGVMMRQLGQAIGMPEKRMQFICYKWGDKDIYDWGVCWDLGWLTPKGKAMADQIIAEITQ